MFTPRFKTIKPKTAVFVYDFWLLVVTLLLLATGLLMVASSSMVVSGHRFGTPFHFLFHQLTYAVIGMMLASFVIHIPLLFWERIGIYLFLFSTILLTLIFVPGLGREINGSMRWLGFGGIGFEVSEFAKFGVIIYLAGYLKRREDEIRIKASGFIKPLFFLSIIAALLLLEPDFGATTVIIVTALAMMFLAGARLWQFLLLAMLVAGAMAFLAVAAPYRLARLTSFLDPWARPFDVGYQLTQSLIAFGRGGIWGLGLGNSIQKLFYLPEAHTDFLFAVLAEEFGIAGGLTVTGLFAFLVAKTLLLGRKMQEMKNSFAAYLAFGFATYFAIQAGVNIGVNAGILPTKGLTLPFISYGGSSMIINFLVISLLLRIHHEACIGSVNALRIEEAKNHD